MVAVVASGGAVSGVSFTSLFKSEYRRPLFFCGVAVIGAFLYGYDGTHFTSILEMTQFKKDFGFQIPGSNPPEYNYSGSNQSLWTSIVQVGEFCGALMAGFIGDRFGRKGGMLSAITLVTIGALLQIILVGSSALLTVGRLILGGGVGIISNAVPLYLSEIPPMELRGGVVSCWQLLLAIGQVIGACVGQGVHLREDTGAWRIPIAVNWAICLVILAGLFFIPESPRWLLYKGKPEKAERALVKIHAGSPDCDVLVQEQLAIINKSRDEERTNSSDQSRWSDLFKGVERRKFFCVVGILVSQQISGVQFIFSYTTTFLSAAGIDDPFIITIIVDILEVLGVVASFFVVNRFGRRPLLLYTGYFMFACLLVCGCLGAKAGHGEFEAYLRAHPAFSKAVAAMICLYVFAFNVAWGPLAWVVASELCTGRNRQKIMSVATACFWLAAFVVSFTLPPLFLSATTDLFRKDEAGLGPMVGFIYCFGAAISIVFTYFVIPETQGRTLEEINFMMEAGIPTRQWKNYDLATVVAKSDKSKRRYADDAEHLETAQNSRSPSPKEVV